MKKGIPLYAVLLLLLLVSALVFSLTFFPMQYRAEREREAHRAKLEAYMPLPDEYDAKTLLAALEYLGRYSAYELPEEGELTEAMIEAVLLAMGDPYATFYTPKEYEERLLSNEGGYYGLGLITAETSDGYAEILFIHPDSPMDGVAEVGDLILAVNGESLLSIGYGEAIERLSGSKETVGRSVSMTLRSGGETFSVEAAYAAVTRQSVISKTFAEDGKTFGYLLLTGFDKSTVSQLKAAVLEHEAAGVDGMIFDVRGNRGGLLNSAAEILAFLLPDGVIALVDYARAVLSDYTISSEDGYLRIGSSAPTVYYDGGHALSVPTVVLINGASASAAELFAKAISDYAERGELTASLVGTTSFGKGSVQTTDPSPFNGAAIKITVASYLPPSGISYDGIGIVPDRVAELPSELSEKSILALSRKEDTQLAAAIDELFRLIMNG